MFDFHIQGIEHVTISPRSRGFERPRIVMKNQHFIDGFAHGFTSAISDQLTASHPLTDDEIIDAIQGVFLEEGIPPKPDEAAYTLGNLVGIILAKA